MVIEGIYSDEKNIDSEYLYPDQINELNMYSTIDSNVKEFSGELNIEAGKLLTQNVTVLHSRSIAEDISTNQIDDTPWELSMSIMER